MKTIFQKTLKFLKSKITKVPLSDEQGGAAEASLDGKSVAINACAGSGKSHTARAVAVNYDGRVESVPFGRKLSEAEAEAFDSFSNINSLNFHRRGIRMLDNVDVKSWKTSDIIADLGNEIPEKLVDLIGDSTNGLVAKLKTENFGIDPTVNAVDVAARYSFEPTVGADLNDRSTWGVIEWSIEVLKLSDAQKDVIDFNDMLRFPVLFAKRATFSPNTLVILDEVQDYTPLSWAFLRECLTTPDSRVLMVGDPSRQALMCFAGARVEIFDHMADHFGCERHELTVNRRCSKAVVRYAPFAGEMKALDDAPEGSVSSRPVADVLAEILDGKWATDALLSETNAPLINVGISLLSAGVPCQMRADRLVRKVMGVVGKFRNTKENPVGGLATKIRKHHTEACAEAGAMPVELADIINCIESLESFCLSRGIVKPDWNEVNGRWIPTHPFEKALNLMLESDTGISLLTGHVAKGLEWETVFHLYGKARAPQSDWEVHQAQCVAHVIATRAILNHVTLIVEEGEGGGDGLDTDPDGDHGEDYEG